LAILGWQVADRLCGSVDPCDKQVRSGGGSYRVGGGSAK
jgi:hypothetical protein